MHVPALYRTETEAPYRGNPLIEALPPLLSRGQIARQTAWLPPAPTAADRALPAHEREHLLTRLGRFHVPLSQDVTLYKAIQDRLRAGYAGRNPLAPSASQIVDQRLAAMAALAQAVEVSPHQITRLGVSGGGKSLGTRADLAIIPQTISHTVYRGRPFLATQVVWLLLDCPHDGSPRGLCTAFFRALDGVLAGIPGLRIEPKETLTARYVRERATADDLLEEMPNVATQFHLGLLCLDEVQVLREARAGAGSTLLNFLLRLVNNLGLPVMLVGTFRAYPLLGRQLRLTRRAESDSFWEPLPATERVTVHGVERVQVGGDWTLFTEALWAYQYTATLTPRTAGLMERLHSESQGIPDLAVRLFALAQRRAIEIGGAETISEDLITAVAENELKIVRPIILTLRNGTRDPEKLARLDDVVPQSLEEMLKLRSTPDVLPGRAASGAGRPDPSSTQLFGATDLQGPLELPGGTVRDATSSPASPAADLRAPSRTSTSTAPRGRARRADAAGGSVSLASDRAEAGGTGATRSKRRQKAAGDVRVSHASAPDTSLRAIVERGRGGGASAHESLAAAALIRPVGDDALGPAASPAAPIPAGSTHEEAIA